jgi:simple sugar transport system permease protein
MEIIALLAATIRMATPILYVAVGETISERAGICNIGLEGLMLVGSCVSYGVVLYSGNLILGVLVSIVVTMLFALVFAFLTITVKADQTVSGLVLNIVGAGTTGFIYQRVFLQSGVYRAVNIFPTVHIPLLSDIPVIGPILFDHNILVYGIFLLVPLTNFILTRTSLGLAIRAVGEHPHTVDSVGLSVNKLRYGSVLFSGALCAIGGSFLSIAYAAKFVELMTAGRGFIAMALVPFSGWKIPGVLWGGLLFGAAYALQLRLQASNLIIPYQFFQILPYLLTALVLIFSRRRSEQPAALGVPFIS